MPLHRTLHRTLHRALGLALGPALGPALGAERRARRTVAVSGGPETVVDEAGVHADAVQSAEPLRRRPPRRLRRMPPPPPLLELLSERKTRKARKDTERSDPRALGATRL